MATSDDESTDVDGISLAQSGYSYDEQDSIFTMDRIVGEREMHDPEVPDKTTEQTMKALEVAAEEESSATRSSRLNAVSRTPSPSSSGDWPSAMYERTPLLDAGPAPPDYSQATAHRTFIQSRPYRRTGHAGTVSQAGEDSGDDLEWTFRSNSRKRSSKSVLRNWRQVCLMNLAVYSLVLTVILIWIQVASRNQKLQTYTQGLSSIYPDHPSYIGAGGLTDPELNKRFHKNTSECSFNSYLLRGFDYPFRTAEFSFVESVEPAGHSRFIDPRISGNIEVRPAPYSQIEPVEVWVSLATTAQWKVVDPGVDEIDNGWRMRFPRLERKEDTDGPGRRGRSETEPEPCLDFWIGVYVKHTYDTWELHSTHANIDIGYPKSFDTDKNWWLLVLNKTSISTTKGNISASFLDSKAMDLRVRSGSIKGNYTFDESIDFTTTSGDIDVVVNQPAARSRKEIPSRLTSSTTTGDTHIFLTQEELPEDWIPRKDQYNLQSHHQSQSGTVWLEYNGWEGVLTGTTAKGSVDISGADFDYCSGADGTVSEGAEEGYVCVVKGSLNSTSTVECLEGNIKVDLRKPSLYWPAVPV